MEKKLDHRDDELIDLGSVTEVTHGTNVSDDPDGIQPRLKSGIVND